MPNNMKNLTNMTREIFYERQPERSYVQLALGGVYTNRQDKQDYQLIEFMDDMNQALFKKLSNQRNKVMSIHDFQNIVDTNNVTIKFDINEVSDDDWKKAHERYIAIKPLLNSTSITLDERASEVDVSARTLRRWRDAYLSANSIASLIDRKSGRRKGDNQLKPHVEKLIQDVINEHFLTIQRPTEESTIREVLKRCYELGIDKPSKNTIRRRISQISEKNYLRGRGFRKRAKQKFTPKPGTFPGADYPLSVIQIDHTPADIILVDDKHRKPIGRPYITLAIDVYSRMVTGYYISLDPPSVTSVGMCLSRSILPKTELLLEHGITDASWDVFGFPTKIHVDNGADFRAESLRKSCMFHGIELEFRPVARPEFGGHIERLIGNVMQKVHELPGTTFSNIKERDIYDSEKNASMTLAEFEQWVLTYITKVYHETTHSGLETTPNEKWKIGIFGNDYEAGTGLPAIPSDPQTLTLDFMPSLERTIQRYGVKIDGLIYYDPCLNSFVNELEDKSSQKKTKFIFRQDPRDISYVWFFDPLIKSYFSVPLANQATPAMSLWEYKFLKKQVKQASGTVNDELIYRAWDDMKSIVSESQSATISERRKEQRRKSHVQSQEIYKPLKEQQNADSDTYQPNAISDINDSGLDYFEDIE
ncbi:Mu transposase C-terminal domain-containing protein [Psychrobacter sp. AOP42-A1-21]|uniref:Mu transposase C-terminal domain-containing protein n=1 Tax=unclassified Psychrobacter TaxID=196806 RepID=UPI00402B600D